MTQLSLGRKGVRMSEIAGLQAVDYAANACREYEHWAATIESLTEKISECWCPNEPGPHRNDAPDPTDCEAHNEYTAGQSCFRDAREDWIAGGPPSLGEIAVRVSHCESCSRLVSYIRQRKHARKMLGATKRKIRHAGKTIFRTPADSEKS